MQTAQTHSSHKQSPRTAVFIDAAHFQKALRHQYDRIQIAYGKLSELLVGSRTHAGTFFYDALPFASQVPSEKELELFAKKRRLFGDLKQLPDFKVREGRTARSWSSEHGKYVYKQKFVDVYLACDLVLLASKGLIDEAVLVTGDSDFIPAITTAQEEGVKVRVACVPGGRDVHRDLAGIADELFVLSHQMVEACRVRSPANDNGRSFSTSKIGRENP